NQIEWVENENSDRETDLSRGDVKLSAATYSMTDERKEKVDFAGPYLLAHQDLRVKSDSDISEATDLNDKKLCSVTGSTSAQNVKKDFAPKAQLSNRGGYSECLSALQNEIGRASCRERVCEYGDVVKSASYDASSIATRYA